MTVATPSVPSSGTAVANTTGQNVSVSLLTGTVQSVIVGYGTNGTPPVATPAVAATTVPVTNTNPFPVQVAIAANGATISAVTVNGTGVGTAAGTYTVPAGGTIAIAYTVATPTWVWTALAYGASGNPIGSLPQNYPLFPGCTIAMLYTVAPTWSWANYIDEGYTPGYGYPFNSTTPTPNQYAALPYAQHAQLAQTGLATGVSN